MPEIFKDLKASYFGVLALAALFMAFFPVVGMGLVCIYVAVDLFYLAKRPNTMSPALRWLKLDLSSYRLYTLLGVFIMTPFDSLLTGALGAAVIGYWVWRAYTAIRDYEAAKAGRKNDSDDA